MSFGFMSMNMEYLRNLFTSEFFYVGVAIGAILLGLFIIVLKIVYYFRCVCHSLVVAEEGGIFEITDVALESFVSSVIARYSQVKTSKMKIIKCRSQYFLSISLKVLSGANVTELRHGIRDNIINELNSKLGIGDRFARIDFAIVQMPDNSDLIAAEK